MKMYLVDVDITVRWTIEVHANNEDEAIQIAEDTEFDDVRQSDYKEDVSAEVINVEEITNVD